MARLVVNNKHQEDTCCDEIGLCAQNILATLLGSIMSGMKRSYVQNLHFGHKYNFCFSNLHLQDNFET